MAPLRFLAVNVAFLMQIVNLSNETATAPSDRPNMVPPCGMAGLVAGWMRVDAAAKGGS